MNTDDWLSLDASETVEWSGRPQLVSAVPQLLAAAGLLVAALALTLVANVPWPVGVAGSLVAVGVGVAGVYPVYTTAYLVTDRAVYAKRGRRAKRVTTVELDRVQDVTYSHSAVGGVLGYGTVTVEVAGGGDVSLSNVADARRAADLVGRLVRGSDRRIPGTTAQWAAVRDELRGIRAALENRR